MKKKHKILSYLSEGILLIIMLIMITTIISKMNNKVPSVFGYSILYITTGSMEPTYKIDSCLLSKKVDVNELKVGDVICFFSTDPVIYGQPNTHRIIDIKEDGNSRTFITKGDANELADKQTVTSDKIIGRVVKELKLFAKIRKFMVSTSFYFIFILLPLVGLLFSEITNIISAAKESVDNDEKNRKENAGISEIELDESKLLKAREILARHGRNTEDADLVNLVARFGEDILESLELKDELNKDDTSEDEIISTDETKEKEDLRGEQNE